MSISAWPPEVISGMIYTGPGSGPMLAAASAWESLAAELSSSATAFQSALSTLSGAWQGPSSATMASASEPYLSWIGNTATGAQQAGAQASAAAAAFETAFGATVPPPVIAANRALLMALIATNFFGQNSPAIAATEADYAEMWAQDVGMMNTYALVSSQLTQALEAFTAAPTVANATAGTQSLAAAATTPASSVESTLASWISSLQGALTSLSDPSLGGIATDLGNLSTAVGTGSLSGVGTDLSALGSDLGTALGVGGATGAGLTSADLVPIQATYYGAMLASMPARMLMGLGNSMANASQAGKIAGLGGDGLLASVGQLVDGKMQAVVSGVSGQLRSWGSTVSAQLAHAASIGGSRLSVPQGWSAAATAMSRAAPILPETTVSSPAVSVPSAGMPGNPFTQAMMGALSGRGLSTVGGKTPKVVPRSPAGG